MQFWCRPKKTPDATRLRERRPNGVRVGGNLKYDFTPPASGIAPDIATFLDETRAKQVWIAASTMPPATAGDVDEDDAVIEAFREALRLRDRGLLLILAPRKPERFDTVAEKLSRAGVAFTRRTSLKPLSAARSPAAGYHRRTGRAL